MNGTVNKYDHCQVNDKFTQGWYLLTVTVTVMVM